MAYPKFKAPEWQTGRISALRQKFAAPQVGRLKRQMSGWMGMGYDPQAVQARRATVRGFGEGLGGIISAAGQSALSQYGQEYATQMRGAELTHQAGMEEERTSRQEQQWGREREEREDIRWGGALPGEYAGGGGPSGPGFGAPMRRPEKHKQRSFSAKEFKKAREGYYNRAKGGPVHKSLYSVGEGGTSSKPKPELVVYKGGRMELVGKKGPEIRTFAKEGQVIPAGKTKRIVKNKGFSIVSRERGGAVKPLHTNIMNYLTATRMDPSGAGHMPYWQFMLQAQPEKLAGMLTYLQGGKPSFGQAGGSPLRTKSREPRPPTKYPGGGTAKPSLEYKSWLERRG